MRWRPLSSFASPNAWLVRRDPEVDVLVGEAWIEGADHRPSGIAIRGTVLIVCCLARAYRGDDYAEKILSAASSASLGVSAVLGVSR